MYAISGSRSEDIAQYQKKQLEAILNSAKRNNYTVHVGDCPTGIDRITIEYCNKNNIPMKIFRVKGKRTPEKLRARTVEMVQDSKWLFSYPKSLDSIRSGTWLATFEACRNNIPVYVCWDTNTITHDLKELPKIKEIDFWQFTQSRYYVRPKCFKVSKQLSMNLKY